MLKEMLRMEKLCAAIGFTRIYSEEHKRKFDIKNDIFKVERNPTDNSKLVLTINKQPIGKWFKEQFGKLQHGFQKTLDEPGKRKGLKL